MRPPLNRSLSETKRLQFRFWQAFHQLMNSLTELPCMDPRPISYLRHNIQDLPGIRVVSSFSPLNSVARTYAIGELRVDLVFGRSSDQTLFDRVFDSRKAVEHKAGRTYGWKSPTSRRRARIFIQRDAEFTHRDLWPDYQAWLKTEVERMFDVLVPKARELAV